MDMREHDYYVTQRPHDLRREMEHHRLVALVTADEARPSLMARIRQFGSRFQAQTQPKAKHTPQPRSNQKPLCEDCPAAARSY